MAKGKNSNIKKESIKKNDIKKESIKKNDIKKKSIEKNDIKKEIIKKNDKKRNVSKARKELIYSSNDSSDEIGKLLKIILIVTGIMILFYGITVLVTKKVNAVKTAKLGKSSSSATIQYDKIIIGSMLKFDGEYYVLIEKDDDEHLGEYDTLLKAIAANDESLKVYTADLNSSFNEKYLSNENNYDSDLDKFKVTGTTLVHVKDKKIEDCFDNYDSIKEKLDDIK